MGAWNPSWCLAPVAPAVGAKLPGGSSARPAPLTTCTAVLEQRYLNIAGTSVVSLLAVLVMGEVQAVLVGVLLGAQFAQSQGHRCSTQSTQVLRWSDA